MNDTAQPTPQEIARQITENSAAVWECRISFEAFQAKQRELWKLAGRDAGTLCAVSSIINGKLPPAI